MPRQIKTITKKKPIMKEFTHGELLQLQLEINGGHETDERGKKGRRVMDGILNIRIKGISQRTKVCIRERSKDVSKLTESITEQYKSIESKVKESLSELRKKYFQNPEEKEKSKLLLLDGMDESEFKKEVKELEDNANKDLEELQKAKHKVEKIDGLEANILEEIDCDVTGDFYGTLIELQKS
jgi:hypothetical protein